MEIKARLTDFAPLRERARAIADGEPVIIDQVDTYFRSPTGRLKLREFSGGGGELIYYDRPDATAPTESGYILSPSSEPASLREALSRAMGVRAVVRKRRTLYMVGRTRVHLDEVEGLGSFVEVEVVLEPGEPAAEGVRTAREIMEALGIRREDLVEGGYIDLLG